MKKTPLTDSSGRWFDRDTAGRLDQKFSHEEEERQNGEGPEGESLFLTPKGALIRHKHHWSQSSTYELVDMAKATARLISNGYQKDLAKIDLDLEGRKLEL
ncbi:hypothetical protein BH10PLA2_BH10PLA2_25000 [soil metagenome]